jgi:hypothetical protein
MQSGQPQLCATGAACVAAICGSGWDGEAFLCCPSSSFFYYILLTLSVLGSISIFKWGCACHAMMNRCVQPCMHGIARLCHLSMQRYADAGAAVAATVLLLRRVDLSHADVGRVPSCFAMRVAASAKTRARRLFSVFACVLAGVCASPEKILRIDRYGAAAVTSGSTDALIGGTTIHRHRLLSCLALCFLSA